MKSKKSHYQESASFFKKNTPDFCEGCVVHGLYKEETDGCIYCRNHILVNNKNKKLKFNKHLSYYDSLFSAVSLKYQSNSSAGGFVTDLLENLLKKNIIDSVISVAFDKKTQVFRYKEFSKYSSLANQQQSVYTKVNLNDALKIILSKNKTFAITATPIACKILRMYQKKNNVIKKRLKFIVGLVSGGYKNDQYIPYKFYLKKRIMFDKFESIRFRDKGLMKKYAGDSYYFSATNKTEIFTLKSGEVQGNWPLGLFKYFASDFCSDTFNKYSDITVMDGWCKKFVNTKGVSLIISRNLFLTNFIKKHTNCVLQKEKIQTILSSQSGGLRHKTIGLTERVRIYKLFGVLPSFLNKYYRKKINLIQFMVQLNRMIASHLSKKLFPKKPNFLRLTITISFYINKFLSKLSIFFK